MLLYEILQDDKSKLVLEAYLNQKITGRFKEMMDVWDKLQYFGDFTILSIASAWILKSPEFIIFPAVLWFSSNWNNNKFYIRAYGGPYSIELVLFAVDQ